MASCPPLALVNTVHRLDPRSFEPYFRRVKPVAKASFAPDALVPAVKTAFLLLGGGDSNGSGGGGDSVSRGELTRAEKALSNFPNVCFLLLRPSIQLQAWVAAHAPGSLVFFAPRPEDVARIIGEDAVPLLTALQADGSGARCAGDCSSEPGTEPGTVLEQTANYALQIRWDDVTGMISDLGAMAQAIAECSGVPADIIAGVLKHVGSLQSLAFLTRGQLREEWGLSRSQANAVADFLDEREIEAPLLLDHANEDSTR